MEFEWTGSWPALAGALVVLAGLGFACLAARETRARAERLQARLRGAEYVRGCMRTVERARGGGGGGDHPPSDALQRVALRNLATAGDGKASTTDRVALTLTFGGGHGTRHVVLKTALLGPNMRIGGAALPRVARCMSCLLKPVCRLDRAVWWTINMYNYYFPHAPDAMYDNESRVYTHLQGDFDAVGLVTPRVLGVERDARGRQWSVLMEDLSSPGAGVDAGDGDGPGGPGGGPGGPGPARFLTALDNMGVSRLSELLASLARLHGRFWQSPRFGGDLAWLPTARAGGMHDVFDAIGFGLIADHVWRHPFEQRLLAPLGLTMERLWDGLEQCNVVLDTPPVTLCHGDAHIQNTYVRSDGTVGMFDFQLTLRACWARDVSYIIGTSLPVELRRRHEDALLRGYLAELNKCCAGADRPAAAPPDFDAAKVLYAQAMAWGLVIGWLICPPNNYGEQIQSANVGRLVAACQDLGTFDLLL